MEVSTCLAGNVAPLQLPIQNVNLASNSYASAKGVEVSISDQIFSLKPSFAYNNIWVTLAGYCVDAQNYSCIAEQHGVYTPPADVNKTKELTSWSGSSIEDEDPGNTYYNDDARIQGHEIHDMPFMSYYGIYCKSIEHAAESPSILTSLSQPRRRFGPRHGLVLH